MSYQSLSTLDQASARVLYRTKTFFPFDLFPDVIEVSDTEVKIIYGLMFYSTHVIHMPFKELLNVQLSTNLFFGRLKFEIKGYENNPPAISYLPRARAVQANAIISGLILCSMNGIDTLQYTPEELSAYLESIGRPETVQP